MHLSEHNIFMLETLCVICWLGTLHLGSKNILFKRLVVGHLLLTRGFWAAIYWYFGSSQIISMWGNPSGQNDFKAAELLAGCTTAGYTTANYTTKIELAVGGDITEDMTKEMYKIQTSDGGSSSSLHSPSAEEQAEDTWFPTDVPFTSWYIFCHLPLPLPQEKL